MILICWNERVAGTEFNLYNPLRPKAWPQREEGCMKKKWIVIANRIEARIYRDRPFVLIETLENELGREKNRAMTTDKPGWSHSRFFGPLGNHMLSGEKSPHEDAAVQFARRLSRFLERQGQARRYDELVIAAEPKMLGRIRGMIPKHLGERIEWLKKDFGHLSDHELARVFSPSSQKVTMDTWT